MRVSAWSEGHDGLVAIYRERLWPGPALIAVVPLMAIPLSVAYGAAFGAVWGWLLGIVVVTVGWAWLFTTAPAIRVDEAVFRAGRARLPRRFVGNVDILDSDGLREQRTRGDVRSFLLVRPGTARRAVAVANTDPQDPHPQWVVHSRHPERLRDALLSNATHHVEAGPDAAE